MEWIFILFKSSRFLLVSVCFLLVSSCFYSFLVVSFFSKCYVLDQSLVETRQLGISCLTAIGIGIGFRFIGTRALRKFFFDKGCLLLPLEIPPEDGNRSAMIPSIPDKNQNIPKENRP